MLVLHVIIQAGEKMEQSALTRDQVRTIDRLAIEQYSMPGVILMENAGRNAAQIIAGKLSHLGGKVVAIFCGPGNNGGDGFVIARHLHNAGFEVTIALAADPAKISGDAAINFQIVRNMPIPIGPIVSPDVRTGDADLIVDALLGTGFTGQVRSPLDTIIEAINSSGKFTVAVDVPSGLDCQTGVPSAPTVRADLTITFVAAKTGMIADQARPYVGKIEVADIGVPRELIEKIAAG